MTVTYREALNQALKEEMRRDDRVFLIGEDVAYYQGAFKVSKAAKIRYMSGGQLSVPIVIRGPGSAAHQLGAQHSQSLEAWFCHVPGLKVVAPATPYDAKGLLKSAVRDENPIIFIEAQLLYPTQGEIGEGDYT